MASEMHRILVVLFLLCVGDCGSLKFSGPFDEAMKAMSKWIPNFPEGVGKDCRNSLLEWKQAIWKGETWALQMLDANGKPTGGLMGSSFPRRGSITDCQTISKVGQGDKEFGGSFFTLSFVMNENRKSLTKYFLEYMNITEGYYIFLLRRTEFPLCVPSLCDLQDVRQIAESIFSGRIESHGLELVVKEVHPKYYAKSTLFAMVVFTILGIAVATGTLIDMYPRLWGSFAKGSICKRVFLCFSLQSNASKVLYSSRKSGELHFIDGIRVISNLEVLIGHVILINCIFNADNVSRYLKLYNNGFFQIVDAFLELSPDNFIFLSGFLLSYTQHHSQERKFQPSRWQLLTARYLKTTIPYVLCIIFSMMWTSLNSNFRNDNYYFGLCPQKWWANILYITNNVPETCFPHGWSLSSEMQLFVFFLFAMTPLLRTPKQLYKRSGQLMLSIFLLLVCGLNLWGERLHPVGPEIWNFRTLDMLLYYSTSSRLGSYLIGFLTGHFVYLKDQIHLARSTEIVLWFVSGSCLMLPVLEHPFIISDVYQASVFLNTSWNVSRRSIWCLGMSWIFFACATGRGGTVNRFLSSENFIFFSRMSFMSYLIHPLLFFAINESTKDYFNVSYVHLITKGVGLITATYALSFFANLLVETPFVELGKIVCGRTVKPSTDCQDSNSAQNKKSD